MKHRFKQIHKTCSMLNLQTSPLCALWKIASTGFQWYYGNLNHLNIICFNIILRLKRHSAIFYTSKSVQCHSPCENTCKMSGRSFPKPEENNPDYVTVMSSGLFQLRLRDEKFRAKTALSLSL